MLALLFVVTAASPSALADLEREQTQLFDKIAPSVVFIFSGSKPKVSISTGQTPKDTRAIGSGFFVDDKGTILTNEHVVHGSKTVTVVLYDGQSFQGDVLEVARDKVDLALVKIDYEKSAPLATDGAAGLRIGQWAGSVGHGEGGIWTFTTGMVTNSYDFSGLSVFQTQIPVNPGASGGPVFDRQGRVAGIVTSGIKDASLVNFAIRVDMAPKYLTKLASGHLTIVAPDGVPVFIDGALAGKGPRVVVAGKKKKYEVSAVIGGKLQKKQIEFPAEQEIVLK
ncbi:MAG: serine protease [Deltaproteobacteria bacterium]|nr:serine protease [Deltaproteobacteria bacterium]